MASTIVLGVHIHANAHLRTMPCLSSERLALVGLTASKASHVHDNSNLRSSSVTADLHSPLRLLPKWRPLYLAEFSTDRRLARLYCCLLSADGEPRR